MEEIEATPLSSLNEEKSLKTEETPLEKEEPIIVYNSNLVELKNACDDYIQKLFESKANFRQNHTHTDVKLVLGYLACGFALFGGYYGHKVPFNEAKDVTLMCIIAYFLLNTLLVLYSFIFEKESIFVGECDESDKKHIITIQTNTKRYSDIYNIIYEYVGKEKQGSSIKIRNAKFTLSKSFGNWFDVNGQMDTERFERDLFEGLDIVKTGNKPHEQ
ncbi:13176_t:CDS:2 [Funneliformis geosporum]|uniref:Signal peptidase complex subunit 2 n=1 Tax=Funneliformis geosporum TaxID=1117311 RepID=A0A9W4SUF8_9GLOM|nr:13176_t:CDS:2 [Funneliformis geosporum]CAI2183597.1 1922_t:CDS:2 [Funneliformis geosporum]